MPEPIGPFSPEAVIEAIEANLVGASVALGRTEDGVVFRGSDVTWVYTGYRSLSRVLRARFAEDQAEDRVAEVCDCFREFDAPVCWLVGPTSWPPNLPDLLVEGGFGPAELWMGLARDLSPLESPAPSGCTVVRATSKIDLQIWTGVGGAPGSCDGQLPDPATADIFAPDNAGGDPRCRYYLATLADGRPVARGMAYQQDDVVGLHWLACDDPTAGHDRAVAARILADARATGARLAVTAGRGAAQATARRLGFAPYCQYNVHAWPPPATAHA